VWYPKIRLEEEGARCYIVSTHALGTKLAGKHGYPAVVDVEATPDGTFLHGEVNEIFFDCIICPGGFAPDFYRRSQTLKDLVAEEGSEFSTIAPRFSAPAERSAEIRGTSLERTLNPNTEAHQRQKVVGAICLQGQTLFGLAPRTCSEESWDGTSKKGGGICVQGQNACGGRSGGRRLLTLGFWVWVFEPGFFNPDFWIWVFGSGICVWIFFEPGFLDLGFWGFGLFFWGVFGFLVQRFGLVLDFFQKPQTKNPKPICSKKTQIQNPTRNF